jgi:small multidrug resistance family-3 protein
MRDRPPPEVSPIFQWFSLFVLAGLAEIGGGYLMWLWCHPYLPAAHFGRVYAAYGGVFVVLSVLWGGRSTGSRLTDAT